MTGYPADTSIHTQQNANITNIVGIQPSDLLQADATIIVGILIFLTISPIARNAAAKTSLRVSVLISTYFTVGFLIFSIVLLLWGSSERSFDLAQLLFVLGLVGLLLTIISVMGIRQVFKGAISGFTELKRIKRTKDDNNKE